MRLNFFARLTSLFLSISLITKIRNKVKYPGIGIANRANLNIYGEFTYGSGCGIGEGVNLVIPEHATLALGDNCYIGRYVELGPNKKIEVGSNTSIQDRCIMLGDVRIGRYCSLAPNVYISSGKHYFDLMPSWLIKDQDKMSASDEKLMKQHSKPVVIEDDCWLGINVVVMSGVTIGKGAVVGANSVVTKDVEPYTVVAGVPAKLIKKRLDFVPLSCIIYSEPDHLPYFYSGFEVSQLCLGEYSKYGGIAAKRDFVICLNAFEGNSIHLMVREIVSSQSSLVYEEQEIKISKDFQEIIFRIDGYNKTRFHFTLNSDSENALLIVQKAWIQ